MNAQILGVSFDTVAENAAFAKKFDFPFPLLCDVDRKMGIAYGAAADAAVKYPSRITFVIGTTGLIEQAHAKVDVRTHPQAVLESLGGAKGPAKSG